MIIVVFCNCCSKIVREAYVSMEVFRRLRYQVKIFYYSFINLSSNFSTNAYPNGGSAGTAKTINIRSINNKQSIIT